MKVGIVGLGLIGGSLARAFTESGEAEVYGCDKNATTQEFARISGVVSPLITSTESAPAFSPLLISV